MDERSRGWIYGSSGNGPKKLTACRFPARAGTMTGNGNGRTFSRSGAVTPFPGRGREEREEREGSDLASD